MRSFPPIPTVSIPADEVAGSGKVPAGYQELPLPWADDCAADPNTVTRLVHAAPNLSVKVWDFQGGLVKAIQAPSSQAGIWLPAGTTTVRVDFDFSQNTLGGADLRWFFGAFQATQPGDDWAAADASKYTEAWQEADFAEPGAVRTRASGSLELDVTGLDLDAPVYFLFGRDGNTDGNAQNAMLLGLVVSVTDT